MPNQLPPRHNLHNLTYGEGDIPFSGSSEPNYSNTQLYQDTVTYYLLLITYYLLLITYYLLLTNYQPNRPYRIITTSNHLPLFSTLADR